MVFIVLFAECFLFLRKFFVSFQVPRDFARLIGANLLQVADVTLELHQFLKERMVPFLVEPEAVEHQL